MKGRDSGVQEVYLGVWLRGGARNGNFEVCSRRREGRRQAGQRGVRGILAMDGRVTAAFSENVGDQQQSFSSLRTDDSQGQSLAVNDVDVDCTT